MKRFKHLLEYVLVRSLDGFIHLLPREFSLSLGEAIGTGVSKILAKRNRLVLENLSRAFPEKPESERRWIARQVWKNIGRTAVEFVRVNDVTPANYEDYLIYQGYEAVEEALRLKKGVIIVGFHFSNWEMTGIAISRKLSNLVAIARPMKNPMVEKWVQSKRKWTGMKIMLHREAVRGSLKVLKANGGVGILVDQNLYTGGEFVTYFGRPAATTTLPALLHSRTKAPAFITYSLREGKKFRIFFEPVKFEGDPGQRLKENTQIISTAIENIVRRHPENWFWVHNRWKRAPEAEWAVSPR